MSNTIPGKAAKLPEAVETLCSIISDMEKVVVAYSGGADSTCLLNICLRVLGQEAVTAVVVDHPLLHEQEANEAIDRARMMGARTHSLTLDPRRIDEVAANTPERCYHCKKFIFSRLREYADQNGIPWVLDGTNADDEQGYRPGIRALEELNVRSPLREAGLTKAMVRQQSRDDKLETWNKPSAPCLATRFPYNSAITDDDLDRVRAGESVLKREGLDDLRLRVHQDVARIEVPENMISYITEKERRQRLVAALRSLGYRYVTLDLEGFRSGSMDL